MRKREAPPRRTERQVRIFWITRKHHKTGENQRDRMTWGLIPYWSTDGTGGRKPINAKVETVASA